VIILSSQCLVNLLYPLAICCRYMLTFENVEKAIILKSQCPNIFTHQSRCMLTFENVEIVRELGCLLGICDPARMCSLTNV